MPAKSTASILIVEDNVLSRKLLTDLLEAHGHRTIATASGAAALELARSEVPDLILLDIELPDMCGIEVTRRLKADRRTDGIPILVVTASPMPGIRRKSLGAGADGFIEKPIQIDALLREIGHHLARRQRGRCRPAPAG